MLLELALVILEPMGYTVEIFESAESALLAFQAADPKPALIITDYAMHKMTGLQLAEACRRIRPSEKFLLISGTVGTETLDSFPVGPDRFLAKPYRAKELIGAVKSLLED